MYGKEQRKSFSSVSKASLLGHKSYGDCTTAYKNLNPTTENNMVVGNVAPYNRGAVVNAMQRNDGSEVIDIVSRDANPKDTKGTT
jgi:hypothetical protein